MNGQELEFQVALHFLDMAILLILVVQILYSLEVGVLIQEPEDNKILYHQLTLITLLF
jgi:hypothetical protein